MKCIRKKWTHQALANSAGRLLRISSLTIFFFDYLGCQAELQMMYAGSKTHLVHEIGMTKVGVCVWWFNEANWIIDLK